MTKKEKFKKFWHKYNMQYLMLAILVYAFNAIMYFIAEFTVPAKAVLTMEIDNQIPFISYFFIFYLLYYPLPPLFLWILSFYDKKRPVFDV